jgi:glycosyltransferase involved in cell wall biosynthesis
MYAQVNELHRGETDLLQRLEGLQAHLLYGDAGHIETYATRSWAHATPEVSVVITSYNDHASVTEAMSSVMSSLGTTVELIVVDDHSEDGSVDAVKQLMASADWFPTKLLARAANAGVGAARNVGVAEARADRVFISDAETLNFPATLQKLSAALDRSPDSAAAYGIIAESSRAGLLSYLPFDAAHLTECDYLAGVAMIRREVWEDLGDYDTQASHQDYEDYEFWLRLAGNGYRAEFLPQFVGRRPASAAPRRPVDVGAASLMNELRDLYPLLPWGQS